MLGMQLGLIKVKCMMTHGHMEWLGRDDPGVEG